MARNTSSNSNRTNRTDDGGSDVFILIWVDHFGMHQRQFYSKAERSALERRLRKQNATRSVDDEDYIVKFYYEERTLSEGAKRQRKSVQLMERLFKNC